MAFPKESANRLSIFWSREEVRRIENRRQEDERKPIVINEERKKRGLSPIEYGDIPLIRISDSNKESSPQTSGDVSKYKYTLNFNPKMWIPVEIDNID